MTAQDALHEGRRWRVWRRGRYSPSIGWEYKDGQWHSTFVGASYEIIRGREVTMVPVLSVGADWDVLPYQARLVLRDLLLASTYGIRNDLDKGPKAKCDPRLHQNHVWEASGLHLWAHGIFQGPRRRCCEAHGGEPRQTPHCPCQPRHGLRYRKPFPAMGAQNTWFLGLACRDTCVSCIAWVFPGEWQPRANPGPY